MPRSASSVAPLVIDEITLDGKRIQVESVDLPLNQVSLDPHNPRIANTVSISISEKGEALQESSNRYFGRMTTSAICIVKF